MNGACNRTLGGGRPGEGSKGQISLNFNYKVNYKDFYTKLWCVFSRIKDKKYIEQDVHSVTWAMPKGWDLGVLGGGGEGQKKILNMWHIKLKMISRTEYKSTRIFTFTLTEKLSLFEYLMNMLRIFCELHCSQ